MKIKLSRVRFLIRSVSFVFFYIIGRTNRLIRLENKSAHPADVVPTQCLIAIWHSQLLLPIYGFRGINASALISSSEDGELMTQAVQVMGWDVVRGSSSRGGAKALLGLVRKVKAGKNIAITVDGPRGPREHVQMGIVSLAKFTGIPILPVALDCTRKKIMNSWDEFMVPLPFGTMVLLTGELIHVPRNAESALMEQKRRELETAMHAMTRKVREAVQG